MNILFEIIGIISLSILLLMVASFVLFDIMNGFPTKPQKKMDQRRPNNQRQTQKHNI